MAGRSLLNLAFSPSLGCDFCVSYRVVHVILCLFILTNITLMMNCDGVGGLR